MLGPMDGSGKPSKVQLPAHEIEAIKAELRRLVEVLGTKRAVGQALKFPAASDSQAIEKALRVRPGREVAEKLYAYLGLTREQFLATRTSAGLLPPPSPITAAVLDESNWTAVGLDEEGSRRIVATIREAIAAAKQPAPAPALAPALSAAARGGAANARRARRDSTS
jgi:hypothetical protein